MRLNRVESFYAFLLYFRSEGNEEGRPITASPHAGSATHGQAAAKAPYKGAAGCGQDQPVREADTARRGNIPAPVSRRGERPLARAATAATATQMVQEGLRFSRLLLGMCACDYMERHSGSVKVTMGPTMPWREITTHGDVTIRRNR
ncbi:hypothetical protein GW17_00057526 [Ensete ventricosum]|nr:hypothetical protein GW17_00057526 [Ensete ventricosum]